MKRKVGIMQPYIFPYIGYFQLISAVDVFVFYNDVNYIKKGWVNRNRILSNGEANLFSVPVLKASQNKLINEIELGYDLKWLNQFYKTLNFQYNKAPYFSETMQLVEKIFELEMKTIDELAIHSIVEICKYLDLTVEFISSSEKFSETKGLPRADRLIEITKQCNSVQYINPSGGVELYDKESFLEKGVNLFFIENEIASYKQLNNEFIGGLSIIDVLMFNNKTEVLKMLNLYQLK